MGKTRKIVAGVLAVVAVGVLFGIVWPTFSLFRSFDHLEQNARKRMSGSELQAWALGLLSQYPTETNFWSGRLGTNFPLRSLYHVPAYVGVHEATSNSPPYVFLMWGGGFIGHCGFEIGPTNFVSYRPGHKWQEGVYFWKDQQ